MNGATSALSFSEKENRCQVTFNHCTRHGECFFHLCTPGDGQQVIFSTREEYEAAMLIIAICLYECKNVIIITFELMSNHVHFILLGTPSAIEEFFTLFKSKLQKHLKRVSSSISLKQFVPKMIQIDTLESLRNQIVYTNRNAYIVDPDETPFTYLYGANSYYFNPMTKYLSTRNYGDLTVREKKELLHSHHLDYPDNYKVFGRYILPSSFCSIALGEAMFRDARHYFHKISRDIESYKEIASLLGDKVYYTDDELVSILYGICKKEFEGQKPSLLSAQDKLTVARRLHFDYNADNAKIIRLLRVSPNVIEEIFPTKK